MDLSHMFWMSLQYKDHMDRCGICVLEESEIPMEKHHHFQTQSPEKTLKFHSSPLRSYQDPEKVSSSNQQFSGASCWTSGKYLLHLSFVESCVGDISWSWRNIDQNVPLRLWIGDQLTFLSNSLWSPESAASTVHFPSTGASLAESTSARAGM